MPDQPQGALGPLPTAPTPPSLPSAAPPPPKPAPLPATQPKVVTPPAPAGPAPKPAPASRAQPSHEGPPSQPPASVKVPMTDMPRRALLSPMMTLVIALLVISIVGFLMLYLRLDGIQSQVVKQGDRNYAEIEEVAEKTKALVESDKARATETQNLKTQLDAISQELTKLEGMVTPPLAPTTTIQ